MLPPMAVLAFTRGRAYNSTGSTLASHEYLTLLESSYKLLSLQQGLPFSRFFQQDSWEQTIFDLSYPRTVLIIHQCICHLLGLPKRATFSFICNTTAAQFLHRVPLPSWHPRLVRLYCRNSALSLSSAVRDHKRSWQLNPAFEEHDQPSCNHVCRIQPLVTWRTESGSRGFVFAA